LNIFQKYAVRVIGEVGQSEASLTFLSSSSMS